MDTINKYYCTYFDNYYLPQFLCLYKSLIEHDGQSVIIAFCLDEQSYNYLNSKKYPSLFIHTLNDLETFEPNLLKIKDTRSKIEYYFTCSPQICRFSLAYYPTINLISYLDADLYFFKSPSIIHKEIESYSIAVISHRNWGLGKLLYNKYGEYNVGWVTFKRDTDGLNCLNEWGDNCIEWCYDKYEDNKFGDQKYLDVWPMKYNCYVIANKGANLAPWNIGQYKINIKNDEIFIDEDCLIFYHFAGLRQLSENEFKTNLSLHFTKLTSVISKNIYEHYIHKLEHEKIVKRLSIREDFKYESLFGLLQYLFLKLKDILFFDKIKI